MRIITRNHKSILSSYIIYLMVVTVFILPIIIMRSITEELTGITILVLLLIPIQVSGHINVSHLTASIIMAFIFMCFVLCVWQSIHPHSYFPIFNIIRAGAIGSVIGYAISVIIRAAYLSLKLIVSFIRESRDT
jgi:hypothetical protein